MMTATSCPSRRHRLEGLVQLLACFSHRQIGGCRGSGPEQLVVVRRGSSLEIQGGQMIHGVEHVLASLG
jgi:hypothetical protein